ALPRWAPKTSPHSATSAVRKPVSPPTCCAFRARSPFRCRKSANATSRRPTWHTNWTGTSPPKKPSEAEVQLGKRTGNKRGAPFGNRNRLVHGLYSRAHIERRRGLRALKRRSRFLLEQVLAWTECDLSPPPALCALRARTIRPSRCSARGNRFCASRFRSAR